jgi:hypothetical protein
MFGNKNGGLLDAMFRFRGSQDGKKTSCYVPDDLMTTARIEAVLAARETFFASVNPLRSIR